MLDERGGAPIRAGGPAKDPRLDGKFMSEARAFVNRLQFEAVGRSSRAYGEDYLSELDRIIRSYVRPAEKNVLEWGMGHTTLFLVENHAAYGLVSFVSIDHDREYLDRVVAQMPAWHGFTPLHSDLMGPKLSDRDPEPNYATLALTLQRRFDLIYIDGRRRLECALVATQICAPDGIVVLHDYRRRRYDLVQVLYDLVEDGSQFRVMRPKPLGSTR